MGSLGALVTTRSPRVPAVATNSDLTVQELAVWWANSEGVSLAMRFTMLPPMDFSLLSPSTLNVLNGPQLNRHKQQLWSKTSRFDSHYDPEQALLHAG